MLFLNHPVWCIVAFYQILTCIWKLHVVLSLRKAFTMQSSVSSIKHLSTEVSDFPSAGNISGWLFSLFYAKSCMAFMSKVIIPFFFSRNFSSLSCNNRMKSYLLLNDHIFDECLWKSKSEGKEIHDAKCYQVIILFQ